jgi:predicted RNase H-like HicB family nuclease
MSQNVRLTATIIPDEEGWYVARCVQVEVASQGRTVDEAMSNLREALELYFEGEPVAEIPQQQPVVAPIEIRLSA